MYFRRFIFKDRFDDLGTYTYKSPPSIVGEQYTNQKAAWDKSHPFPFKLAYYGSNYEYHGRNFIIVLPNTIIEARRGCPKKLRGEEVSEQTQEIDKIRRFCDKYHLEVGKPGLWLCSTHGEQETEE